MRPILPLMSCALLVFSSCAVNAGVEQFPDAQASDPARLKWMVGAPPPPDKTLRFEDGSYFRFPALRWSVANFRQLMPTVNVSRGLAAASALPQRIDPRIEALPIVPIGADQPLTWRQTLEATYTDGIVVLHRGPWCMSATSGYSRKTGNMRPCP